MQEKILILDFGSPHSQLIGRRVRELNVYCEIHPYNRPVSFDDSVRGVILSGTFAGAGRPEIPAHLPVLDIPTDDVLGTANDSAKLRAFLVDTSGCRADWTPATFVQGIVEELKTQLGDDRVVLGLSGGVDSSVTAQLLHRAIGKNLVCIFVDHGLLRKHEFEDVLDMYKTMGLNVIGVRAGDKFLGDLKGVTDPEQKRKIIGRDFIEVFDQEAQKLQHVKWLAQGTIYPDIIESFSVHGSGVAVKSHHNVGGLPEKMHLKIVEPLRMLFKDEVRRVGAELGMPAAMLARHPFPGPGLGIRVLGEVTPQKVRIIQDADKIFIDSLRAAGLYDKVWQAAAILLPVQSTGVSDDARTYENCVALRAVLSIDAMTADWAHLPYEFLAQVSSNIICNVQGVNRVVYDISSKPPATIEWE
jgi:GMP synthase (glutamine-hydrolysing)